MDAEFFQWGQLVIGAAQLVVSGVGLAAILIGLVRMKEAGRRRDREIDEMAAAFREQAVEGGRRSEALAELLRRTA